jgi:hypothetical protein
MRERAIGVTDDDSIMMGRITSAAGRDFGNLFGTKMDLETWQLERAIGSDG